MLCAKREAAWYSLLNGRDNPASLWKRLNLKLFQSFFLHTDSPSFIFLVSIQYNPIWNNVYNWRLKQMYRCLSSWESIRICYEHSNTVLPQNKLHISFRFELNKIFSSQHSSVFEEAEIKKPRGKHFSSFHT